MKIKLKYLYKYNKSVQQKDKNSEQIIKINN